MLDFNEYTLYNAPFPPEKMNIFVMSDPESADLLRDKLCNSIYKESSDTTCPPKDGKWWAEFAPLFESAKLVAFLVNNADRALFGFATDAAADLRGIVDDIRIVEIPKNMNLAEAKIMAIFGILKETPKYAPPTEKCEPEDENKVTPDARQESNKAEPEARPKSPAHFRHKKIAEIKKYRQWCRKEGRKSYTFVGSWQKAAREAGKLTMAEAGAIWVIAGFLNSPYALECWPGEKALRAVLSIDRKTWFKNRDNLEKKGWILVEKFGRGASPIIYPKKPGQKCPSKFAPKGEGAGDDANG